MITYCVVGNMLFIKFNTLYSINYLHINLSLLIGVREQLTLLSICNAWRLNSCEWKRRWTENSEHKMLVTAERARGKRGIGRGKEGGLSTVDPPQVHMTTLLLIWLGTLFRWTMTIVTQGKKEMRFPSFLFLDIMVQGSTLVSSGFKLVSLNTYFEL